MPHAFGSSDRCGFCDVRWHRRYTYPCIDERNDVKTPQRKRSDVIQQFEDTRNIHFGDVSKAAEVMGMSPAALDRALYRAKKAGWEGEFKCLSKKSRKEVTVVYETAPVEHYHEEPLPPRPNALYGSDAAQVG